jgi:hypothetical protein
MALITVMLCIVGVLSVFTGIVLHALRSVLVQLEQRTGRREFPPAPPRT